MNRYLVTADNLKRGVPIQANTPAMAIVKVARLNNETLRNAKAEVVLTESEKDARIAELEAENELLRVKAERLAESLRCIASEFHYMHEGDFLECENGECVNARAALNAYRNQ